MRIAVIGTGNVGGTLGRRWAHAGHTVKFGVRDPADPKVADLLAQAGPNASAGSVAEAAEFGDAVVLAVPYGAARDALREAGDLGGKVVVDCTNPLKPDLSGLEVGQTTSAAEEIAALAPGARVVKAFNTTGAGNMENPVYNGRGITMFYAADDAQAKAVATDLAASIGFEPVDAGPLANARLLEPFAMLWIYLAYPGGQGTDIALTVVAR